MIINYLCVYYINIIYLVYYYLIFDILKSFDFVLKFQIVM